MNVALGAKLYLPPARVIGAFAGHHQVSEATLLHGPSQTRAITELRHQLMWLLHDLTEASQATIGQIFNRDQSTVWEAIARISDRLASDPELRRSLRDLREKIVTDAMLPPELVMDRRATSARLVAAAAVLKDKGINDADARHAALTILNSMIEAPRV